VNRAGGRVENAEIQWLIAHLVLVRSVGACIRCERFRAAVLGGV